MDEENASSKLVGIGVWHDVHNVVFGFLEEFKNHLKVCYIIIIQTQACRPVAKTLIGRGRFVKPLLLLSLIYLEIHVQPQQMCDFTRG